MIGGMEAMAGKGRYLPEPDSDNRGAAPIVPDLTNVMPDLFAFYRIHREYLREPMPI
jgi:hypothetical protein